MPQLKSDKSYTGGRLGRDVDVWFGDQPAPAPESIVTLHDQSDRPRAQVSQADGVIWSNWIQSTEASFVVGSYIKIEREKTHRQ